MARDFQNQDNKLVQWLKASEVNQGDFARQINTHQTTISRLCRGQLVPTLELACAIEDATEGAVSHRYWLELHGLVQAKSEGEENGEKAETAGSA